MTTDHTPSPTVAPGYAPASGNREGEADFKGLARVTVGLSAPNRRITRLEPTVAA